LFNQINLRPLFIAFPYAKRFIFTINNKVIAYNLKKEKNIRVQYHFLVHITESNKDRISIVELSLYIFGTEIEYRFYEL